MKLRSLRLYGLLECALLLAILGLIFLPEGTPDASCQGVSREVCISRVFPRTLARNDLEGASQLVASLSRQSPQFEALCHEYMHEIGEQAFLIFSSGEPLVLPKNVTACGYGFYHGLVEKIAEEGSLEEAGAFCDYLKDHSGTYSLDAEVQCYHGLGHGSVVWHGVDFPVSEIVARGIRECEQLTHSDRTRLACGTGIFGGVGSALSDEFHSTPHIVLGICRDLSGIYANACATSFGHQIAEYAGYDLDKMLSFLDGFGDPRLAGLAFEQTMSGYGQKRFSPEDWTEVVRFCDKLSGPPGEVCIRGYAAGLYNSTNVEVAGDRLFDFCRTSDLSAVEAANCWYALLDHASQRLSEEGYYDTCERVATVAPGVACRKLN